MDDDRTRRLKPEPRGKSERLTVAMRPVAEAAATARPDCRRAFLNMVMGVQRVGEWFL